MLALCEKIIEMRKMTPGSTPKTTRTAMSASSGCCKTLPSMLSS